MLSYSTQDHHLKDGTAHRDLGPLTPNISQETARDPAWWNQMTSLYPVDIKQASTIL